MSLEFIELALLQTDLKPHVVIGRWSSYPDVLSRNEMSLLDSILIAILEWFGRYQAKIDRS
jgi:hypothetical protein